MDTNTTSTTETESLYFDYIFICKVDISNSLVDPNLFFKRNELMLNLPDTFTQEQVDQIKQFVDNTYAIRKLFDPFNLIGWYFTPDNEVYIINTDITYVTEITHKINETVYIAVYYISIDNFKEILKTDVYLDFKKSANEMKTLLGWDIGEYRAAEYVNDPALVLDYGRMEEFYNNSIAI
jgi:hypothetical protein